jgi:DNA (cytosine-5)-methyltransferase 1
MENVRGLLSARLEDRSVLTQILRDLQEPTAAIRTATGTRSIRAGDAAYRVWSLVKKPGNSLIDASPLFEPCDDLIQCEDSGIPQARHRVIILGIRDDLAKSRRTLIRHERSISLRVGCVKPLRRRTIPPVDAISRSRCLGAKP